MRVPRRVWRGVGLLGLMLSLLDQAAVQPFAQVAGSGQSPLPRATKTDPFESKPLAFAQSSFPDAMIGVPFQSSMQAIGGSGFFSLTVTGDVPPGLKVETGANTVAVGGVPTATGEYQLKINVADVNGNTLTSEFTIHVYPQVPGAKALVPIDPTDTEAFTFTDKEDVFFPAKVIDNENFTFTDSEKGLDAAVIVDNEHFSFTDSEKGLDAAVIVDTEKFSFTDTESVQVNNAVTPVITWATPAPITYGIALSATQLDASSTVAGTFEYSPPLGAVLGAGSQILSVDFAPTDTADYTTASKTVTLGVNQATLTVTASSPTVAYGSPVPSITPGYSGFQNGDTASMVTAAPTCTTTYTTTTPVNAPSPLTSCSGGVVTSNYSLSYVSGTVTITQAASPITWNPPSAITYGTALSATQLNATSTVPGSFMYTPALGTVLGAGTQTLSVKFTPTDAIDYTTVTQTVSLLVNQATPIITWATPAAINYGTALSSTQLNASTTPAGSFVYTPAAGAVLTAGTQTLSVTFTPTDAIDYTTATQTVSLVVNQATPAITWATPAPITYGTALSATQLDATAGIAGNFVYLPASGTVLSAGLQTLSVTFTPTDQADYSTATDTTQLTVNQASQSITFTPLTSPVTYGVSPITLSATGGASGNPVVFSLISGPGSLSGSNNSILTVNGAGTIVVAANQAGNTNYAAAAPVNQSLQVTQAKATVTLGNLNQTYTGSPLLATATTTPAGLTVTFTYNGSATPPTAAGSYTVVGTVSNPNYQGTATGTMTINQATPSITWPTPTPIAYGTALSGAQLDASSTVAGTFAYTPPAGTVLNVGSQMLSVTLTPTDTTDYTTATTSVTLTVNQGSQTITLSAGTLAYASGVTFGVAPLTLSATATSGLPVTFSLVSGPAILSSNTLTIDGAGTVVIAANQPGNGSYSAAPQITETIPVNKAQPIAAIASSVNPVLVQNGITLTATVTSGAGTPTGTVTFLDGATPLGTGTLSGGVATFTTSSLAVGSHSITAAYGGDANFLAATSTPVTQLVEDFGFTISSQTVTVLPGGSAVFTFTVSPIGATTFPAAITLTASGLPAGATYTFSPKGLTAGEGATTVTLTVDVPQTLAGINPAKLHPNVQLARSSAGSKTGPRGSLPVGVVSRLAPFALAFILLPFAGRLRRAGKRLGRVLSVLVLLCAGLAAIAGISGCGSTSGFFAQQQETYTVIVTGTSGALSHSATVTLTVE